MTKTAKLQPIHWFPDEIAECLSVSTALGRKLWGFAAENDRRINENAVEGIHTISRYVKRLTQEEIDEINAAYASKFEEDETW